MVVKTAFRDPGETPQLLQENFISLSPWEKEHRKSKYSHQNTSRNSYLVRLHKAGCGNTTLDQELSTPPLTIYKQVVKRFVFSFDTNLQHSALKSCWAHRSLSGETDVYNVSVSLVKDSTVSS